MARQVLTRDFTPWHQPPRCPVFIHSHSEARGVPYSLPCAGHWVHYTTLWTYP